MENLVILASYKTWSAIDGSFDFKMFINKDEATAALQKEFDEEFKKHKYLKDGG